MPQSSSAQSKATVWEGEAWEGHGLWVRASYEAVMTG